MSVAEVNRALPTTPKGTHVPEVHPLDRLSRWVTGHRRSVFVAWALLVLAMAPLAATLNGALSGAGWDANGSTSADVRKELQTNFPELGAEAAVVVYQQQAPLAGDPSGLQALLASLASAPNASVLLDPLTQPSEAGLIAADGRTALVPVRLKGSADADLPKAAGDLIGFVDGLALPVGARAEVTGEWPVWSDFNQTNEEALHRAELLSGFPSVLLLFLVFGTALAAGLPLVLAVAGIAFGFGALHLIGTITPLSVWAMNFSMMIGLAVGIDYNAWCQLGVGHGVLLTSRSGRRRAGGRAPGGD
jgi:RND superfamily putative drug exporter